MDNFCDFLFALLGKETFPKGDLLLKNRISFILFTELWRFVGEIETDNLTVSNSEIITFDFTVSKNRIFVKYFHLVVD